jgi:hypothetical protein
MLSKIKQLLGIYKNKIEQDGFFEASRLASNYITERVIGRPLRRLVRPLTQPPVIYYHSRNNDEWNVFNKEWDLLIVLDTCRPDALRQVMDEYPFIDQVDSEWSVGSSSSEWILNTFDRSYREEISETAYITSNPYSRRILANDFDNPHLGYTKKVTRRLQRYAVTSAVDPDAFHTCGFLWDSSGDYGPVRYPSPRTVTNHAISLDRHEDSPPKMIVHYMPPHTPYIARYVDGEIEFGEARKGFDAYLDNLRWALNEVALLLENVSREKVVITADHGNNFLLKKSIRSDHTPGMVAPSVRRVPWVETSATDKRTYIPDLEAQDEESMSAEETLEALGYLS